MAQLSVPLSTPTFLRLAAFLEISGSERDPVETVEEAVIYWLENAEWKLPDLVPDAVRGYSWKIQKTTDRPAASLFLPQGSTLRIKVREGFEYAKVEGDQLIYRGESVSPNQFAAVATGSARDAWRDVWVKRPSDHDYQHADALRQAQFQS